jgi:hypothetical protein
MFKKTIIFGIFMLFFCGKLLAENDAPPLVSSAPKKWYSKDSQDTITIDNVAGQELIVEITADDDQVVPGTTGIVVYNCDDDNPKQYVKAGSSITCRTHDANNPIKLESDRAGQSASGTYILRTR